MKNDEKSSFFKLVSSDHMVVMDVSGYVLESLNTYLDHLNTSAYTYSNVIHHPIRDNELSKFSILGQFSIILTQFVSNFT